MKKVKLKAPEIDFARPQQDWIKDIAHYYAIGMPLSRLAEVYNIPKTQIDKWIADAIAGKPEMSKLKKAISEAAKKKEADLLSTMYDLSKGNTTIKTLKIIRDKDGNIIRQEETIQNSKPDTEAIKYLLELSSKHYENNSKSNINVNNVTPVQVNIVDNNRPVIEQDIEN